MDNMQITRDSGNQKGNVYYLSLSGTQLKLLGKNTETTAQDLEEKVRIDTICEALFYYGMIRKNADYYMNPDQFHNWYGSVIQPVIDKVKKINGYADCYYQIMDLLDPIFGINRKERVQSELYTLKVASNQ